MTVDHGPPAQTRFIVLDPNKPRYSRRIQQDEWAKHKALLLQLQEPGFTRESMVQELARRRDFHVKKNQLDNQLSKWGIHVYKKGRDARTTSAPFQIAIADADVRESETRNSHSRQGSLQEATALPCVKPIGFAARGDSRMTFHYISDTEDAAMIDFVHGKSEDLSDHQLLDESSDSSSAESFVPELFLTHKQRTTVPLSSPMDDASQTSGLPPPVSLASLSLGDFDSVKPPTTCNPVKWKHNQFLQLPHYSVSPVLFNLQQITMKANTSYDSNMSDEIHQLTHAGNLLHAMKEYDLAFDVFLLVLRYANDYNPSNDCPSLDLISAVLNCARSAQLPHQRLIATEAITQILPWLEIEYSYLVTKPIQGHYPRTAPSPVASYNGMVSCEPDDHVVNWAVFNAAARCSTSNTYAWLPEQFSKHWLNGARDHLEECSMTQKSILDSLETFLHYVQSNANFVDYVLKGNWDPAGDAEMYTARVLSCHLLNKCTSPTAISSSRSCSDPLLHKRGFPWGHSDLTLAITPFLVMEHIQQLFKGSADHLSKSDRQNLRVQPSKVLLVFTRKVQSNIKSSQTEYNRFLKFYLESMVVGVGENKSGAKMVSPTQIFEVAAATAMLFPKPRLSWVVKHPLASSQEGDSNIVTSSNAFEIRDTDSLLTSSSMSTGFRSFRELSNRVGQTVAISMRSGRTKSSDAMSISSHSSWKLRIALGLPNLSSNSSTRDSYLSL